MLWSDGSLACNEHKISGRTRWGLRHIGFSHAIEPSPAHAGMKASPSSCTPAVPECGSSSAHKYQTVPCSPQRGRLRHKRLCSPSWQRVWQLLVLAGCIYAITLGPLLASATEINSAVSIFGPWDYELRPDGTSRCTDMVRRTAQLGLFERTLFLPTLFWVSKHPDGFFETNTVSRLQNSLHCFGARLPFSPGPLQMRSTQP